MRLELGVVEDRCGHKEQAHRRKEPQQDVHAYDGVVGVELSL